MKQFLPKEYLQFLHGLVAICSAIDIRFGVYCIQQKHCDSAMHRPDAVANAADQPTGLCGCQ